MSNIELVSVTNEDIQTINVEISNLTNSVNLEFGQNIAATLDFHNQDPAAHVNIIEKLTEKVDIEQGKGLSQNDFTDELKARYNNYQNSISDIMSNISNMQEDISDVQNSIPQIATQNQAISGTDDTTIMTPLKVLQCINENAQTPAQAYITQTYQNGSSWYRVYSDGWCEQGGYEASTLSGYPDAASTYFLQPFKDTNYTLTLGVDSTYANSLSAVYYSINNKYTNYFTSSSYGVARKYWYACGYIR